MTRITIDDEDGVRLYDCESFIFSAIVKPIVGKEPDATWETDVKDSDEFDALLYYLEDEFYSA